MVCPPKISVTKTVQLSKVGDSVHYNIEVCNTGLITVNKGSVVDPFTPPGVDAAFGASLAPGACEAHGFDRTVLGGDPDPLVNTVAATYTGGPGPMTATASARRHRLFQPGVDVTKSCAPQVQVGEDEVCTIHITNTSSTDSPA